MPDEKVNVIFKGKDELSSVTKKISLGLTAVGAAAAVAAAAIAGGLVRGIKNAIDETQTYTLAVSDLSKALSMSTQDASVLYNLADDLRIQMPELEMAFKRMVQNGISPSIEGLMQMADRYNELTDATKRAKFLVDNFGRSGLEMSRILELGRAGLAAYARDLEAGLVIDARDEQAVLDFYAAIDRLNDSILAMKLTVGQALMPAISSTANMLSDWLANNQPIIDKIAGMIKNKGMALLTLIEGFFVGFDNRAVWTGALKNFFGETLGNILIGIVDFFTGLNDFLSSDEGYVAVKLVSSLLSGFAGVVAALKVIAGAEALGAVIGMVGQAALWTMTMIGLLILAVGALIGVLFDERFRNGANRIGEALTQAIRDKLQETWDAIDAWGIGVGEMLTQWRDDRIADLVAWVTDFSTAGVDLVKGLWDGMKSELDKINEKWKAWAAGLPAWLKKILKISSPSRVFFDIGKNMMLGLEQGLQRGMAGPQLALSGAIAAPSPAAAPQNTELMEIRDEIRWMVRKLPATIKEAVLMER